jgi:hypothetical protein
MLYAGRMKLEFYAESVSVWGISTHAGVRTILPVELIIGVTEWEAV